MVTVEAVHWLRGDGVRITKMVAVKAVYKVCEREFYGYTKKLRKTDGLQFVTGITHFRDRDTGVEVLQVQEVGGLVIDSATFEGILRRKITRWQNTKKGDGYQYRMIHSSAVVDKYVVAKVAKLKYRGGLADDKTVKSSK